MLVQKLIASIIIPLEPWYYRSCLWRSFSISYYVHKLVVDSSEVKSFAKFAMILYLKYLKINKIKYVRKKSKVNKKCNNGKKEGIQIVLFSLNHRKTVGKKKYCRSSKTMFLKHSKIYYKAKSLGFYLKASSSSLESHTLLFFVADAL